MLFAMAGQPGQGGASAFISLVPIILIFLVFYLLLILPQQRRQKEHRKLLSSLKKGDKVVTTGGVHGQVTKVGEATLTIKVADKFELIVDRSAIARVI